MNLSLVHDSLFYAGEREKGFAEWAATTVGSGLARREVLGLAEAGGVLEGAGNPFHIVFTFTMPYVQLTSIVQSLHSFIVAVLIAIRQHHFVRQGMFRYGRVHSPTVFHLYDAVCEQNQNLGRAVEELEAHIAELQADGATLPPVVISKCTEHEDTIRRLAVCFHCCFIVRSLLHFIVLLYLYISNKICLYICIPSFTRSLNRSKFT